MAEKSTSPVKGKGKALPHLEKPFHGAREDWELRRAIKLKTQAPRGKADKAAEKRAANTCRKARVIGEFEREENIVDNDVCVASGRMRSVSDKLARGIKLDGADRYDEKRDGYRMQDGSNVRTIVAIEGRIHNTPVGSTMAMSRSDSPFKRAKKAFIVERR